MAKNSIVDLGSLTKPAEILTERVCDAVGAIYKPRQIRNIAKAESDAELIKAKAEIAKSKLMRAADIEEGGIAERAIARLISEEVQKQYNSEEVLSKAIDKLRPNAQPEAIETDFLSRTMSKASATSDEGFQELWASILAGEANSPGSISKRTVDIVDTLSKKDAELFTAVCSACFRLGNHLILFSTKSILKVFEDEGIKYEDFVHLSSIGLLSPHSSGLQLTFKTKSHPFRLPVHGLEGHFWIEFCKQKEEHSIDTGAYMLTTTGTELHSICDAAPRPDIFDALISDQMKNDRLLLSDIKK
jgi:hypothetical protein